MEFFSGNNFWSGMKNINLLALSLCVKSANHHVDYVNHRVILQHIEQKMRRNGTKRQRESNQMTNESFRFLCHCSSIQYHSRNKSQFYGRLQKLPFTRIRTHVRHSYEGLSIHLKSSYVTKNDHFAQCAAYESGFSAESKIHCLYKKDDFANTDANCRVHTGIFPCLFVRQQQKNELVNVPRVPLPPTASVKANQGALRCSF